MTYNVFGGTLNPAQSNPLKLSGFCPHQTRWASTRRNIHPLTPIVVINHTLSASSIYYSMASSLFNLRAWQSFSTNSLQVFFGLPLGLAPSTSYSIHFFTQSLSSFRNTCQYYHNLFCCSTGIMSSKPSLCLTPLLGTLSCSLMPQIHLTILVSAHWSVSSFSFLTGHVLLPCNILLLRTQLLYNLPLTVNDMLPSVLWRCWLGGDAGMVICLGRGADLHIWPSWCHCHSLFLASVNPDWFYLPGFTFLDWLTRVIPDTVQVAVKRL